MNLPADASNDQSNAPPGYYRRINGMLHQLQANDTETGSNALTEAQLSALDAMTKEELIALVQRMARQCGMVAAMSEDETAQAMLDTLAHTALKPIIQGVNMRADIQNRLSSIDKWLDRTKGKAIQRIDQRVLTVGNRDASELSTAELFAMLRHAQEAKQLPGNVRLLEGDVIDMVDVTP